MKPKYFLLMLSSTALFVSCANQSGDDYDVSNPYAAPDYGAESVTSNESADQPSDVNIPYGTPAVYEDATAEPIPNIPITPVTPTRPIVPAKVHTVVSGDSLSKISKQYGVSMDSIKSANNMTKDTVFLGSKLKIPAK